jgi:kynurenine formamidase
LEKLYNIDTCVLQIPYEQLSSRDGKRLVSLENLRAAEKEEIPEGCAVLIGTGYGKFWVRKDFFSNSWFLEREAVDYLISKKIFLLGCDSAEWENPKNPGGIFNEIYSSNILILAPCINIEKIVNYKVKLIVFPFNVQNSFICPVRAAVVDGIIN